MTFDFVQEQDTGKVVKERFCPRPERRSGKRHKSLASRVIYYMAAGWGERTEIT